MSDIIRRSVQRGSVFKVWVEPIEGTEKPFRVTARMRDSNQNLIWNDLDIHDSATDNPMEIVIEEASKYYTIVRVFFAGDVGAKVFNKITWTDDKGVVTQHGNIEERVLPANGNSISEVFMFTTMSN